MWFWVLGFKLSELTSQRLRYRIPSTPQISFFNEPQRHREHRVRAIAPPPTSQTAIAPPQLPQTAIAPSQPPKSDRIPLTSPIAIAPPQLPQKRSHSLNFPKSDRTPKIPNIAFYLTQSCKER
jgi:hypothetical protein